MANNLLEYVLRIKDEATGTLQNFSNTLGKTTGGIEDFGKKALKTGAYITASTLPLTLYGKSAFDLAVDIETAWARVAKVYDGSADSIKNELIPAASKLSTELGQNKLEVIDVMEQLAAMGETGSDLIDKTTQAINFQTLSGLGLNEALSTVIATSAIWGVKGIELTKMLSAMNESENAGAASMGDLGIAMSTVGNVAKVSGVDIRELNAFMSVLRLRSVEAGEGANALKTIFTRLRKSGGDAEEILKKYGVTIEEVDEKTGKSNGKLKDADQILIDIAKSWNKMTDAERESVSFSIGTMYQKDKFLALMDDLNSENSEYNKILQAQADDTKNLSNAEKELAIFRDTNAFKMQQATARFAEMKEVVGSTLLIALTPFIEKVSQLAMWFSNLDPKVQSAVVSIGALTVASGIVLTVIGGMAMGISALITAITGIGSALIFLVTNPIGLAITAIGLLIIGVLNLTGYMDGLKIKTNEVAQSELDLANQRTALEESIRNQERLDLNLQQAQLNVENATERVKIMEGELASARVKYGESSEQYQKKERELEQAKIDLKNSEFNVKDAQDKVMQSREEVIKQADELEKSEQKIIEKNEKVSHSFGIIFDSIRKVWEKLGDLISRQREYNGMSIGGGDGGGGGGGKAYAKGGWVDKTEYAKVHQGEFMLSKDMLAGKKSVPEDVKGAIGGTGSGVVVEVSAVVNTPIDIIDLGNIIGAQLAFAGR